jgi:hypothetical protein
MSCYPTELNTLEGSVPEFVVRGKMGFVVNSFDAKFWGMKALDQIDLNDCCRHMKDHFSIGSVWPKNTRNCIRGLGMKGPYA